MSHLHPLAGLLLVGLGACAMSPAPDPAPQHPLIVTVVKVASIPWFERMAEGVRAFGERSPAVRTRQVGPVRADAALQVDLIRQTLAHKPDALALVPIDPAATEAIAREALANGVVVVTHEADNMVNTQADVEAFDNAAFGAALNQRMARCMGHQGQWASFVGSRASRTHVQWTEGGEANARQHPGMVLVASMNESHDDADRAYELARALLKRHPDLKGFQGAASSDVIGIGRAVREAGAQNRTCVFGTGLPSRTRALLDDGSVKGIGFWDAKDAGLAINEVARRLLAREPLSDGMDLGVPGYRRVSVRPGAGRGVVIVGDAALFADRSNHAIYPF